MTRRRRALLAAAVALALVAVAAVVVVVVRRAGDDDTRLQRAVALAPDGAQRLSWTDWSGVREEVGATDVGLRPLLDEGYDADLTATSALLESAEVLDTQFGFSPRTLDWELFAQGTDAASVLMGLPRDAADGVADRLSSLGYVEESGRWVGSDDLTTRLGVTPELTYLAVDDERDLLVASDSLAGLDATVEGLDDDAAPDVDDVVAAIGSPVSAAVYTGDQACNALAMAAADDADQAEAATLLAEAGDIDPLTGFALGQLRGGAARVALSFETEGQARANADSRAALAAGPAPGQGGTFAERFELGDVVAEGPVVTMELAPTEGAYVLSDLSTGPLLFATC